MNTKLIAVYKNVRKIQLKNVVEKRNRMCDSGLF